MPFKVYPDQSKNYWSAADALEDLGYKYVQDYEISGRKRNVFEHSDEGMVYFLGMDHFNATFYSITSQRLQKPLSEYKEWQQGW